MTQQQQNDLYTALVRHDRSPDCDRPGITPEPATFLPMAAALIFMVTVGRFWRG